MWPLHTMRQFQSYRHVSSSSLSHLTVVISISYLPRSQISLTGSVIIMSSGIYFVDQVLFIFTRKTTSPIIDCVLERPLPTANSMAKIVLL